MKKKLIPLILVLVMVLGISVAAVEQRAAIAPRLSFSGTTATCTVGVSQSGAEIEVTLELWCGDDFIDSWSKSGTSMVKISETCKVSKGNTYTLIASGTINGSPFESYPVTKTCK